MALPASRLGERAALALCAAVYLALTLACLQSWEPSHDEGVTWVQVFGRLPLTRWPEEPATVAALFEVFAGTKEHGPRELIDMLFIGGGMHPPGYYLAIHAYARATGGGQMAMGIPAALWGVATVVGCFRLARRVLRRPGMAVWAAALVAVSPWFVGFSVLARPYSLAICLAVWSTLATFEIARASARGAGAGRARAAFVLLSIAGMYTIYHYAFVIAWEMGWLSWVLWVREGRDLRAVIRRSGPLFGSGLAVVAGYAPWLPSLFEHLRLTGRSVHYFAGTVPLEQGLQATGQLLALFALGESLRAPLAPWLVLGLVLLAGLTLPLAWLALRGPKPGLEVAAFWISLPLLPGLILAADIWHGTHTLFITKTGFVLLPLLVVGLVRLLDEIPNTVARSAAGAAWTTLLLVATLAMVETQAGSMTPYDAAARHLKARDSSAHLIVISSPLPGYATPLILSMREAGVREAGVTFVSRHELPNLVAEATAGGRYREISLVNLDVGYQKSHVFLPEQIDQAKQAAIERRWKVVELDPALVPNTAGRRGPTLWLLGPLEVKSFSM